MLPIIVDIPALNLFVVFFLAGAGWVGGSTVMAWLVGKAMRRSDG